jgi:hypothetical protein
VFKKFYGYINVHETLKSEVKEEIKTTLFNIKNEEEKYKALSFRKWFVFGFGLIIGLIAGLFIPMLINKVTNSAYKRASLDNIMKELLGNYTIS